MFKVILQFGIVCWGDSVAFSYVFTVQKKIIIALLGFCYKRSNILLTFCKILFVDLGILTLLIVSLFIFECATFFRNHPHYFNLNNNTHSYNTRQNADIAIIDNLPRIMLPWCITNFPV